MIEPRPNEQKGEAAHAASDGPKARSISRWVVGWGVGLSFVAILLGGQIAHWLGYDTGCGELLGAPGLLGVVGGFGHPACEDPSPDDPPTSV